MHHQEDCYFPVASSKKFSLPKISLDSCKVTISCQSTTLHILAISFCPIVIVRPEGQINTLFIMYTQSTSKKDRLNQEYSSLHVLVPFML